MERKIKYLDFMAHWRRKVPVKDLKIIHVFGKPAWRVLFSFRDELYMAHLKGPGKGTLSKPRLLKSGNKDRYYFEDSSGISPVPEELLKKIQKYFQK